MGLTFSKGIRVGPFRFNLSGSGLGVSTGIKGLRIGTGPRGTYISMGRGGFRYRAYLNDKRRTPTITQPTARPRYSQDQVPDYVPQDIHSVQMTEIRSADVAYLVDESSADFLAELNTRNRRISLVKAITFFSILIGMILTFLSAQQPDSKMAAIGLAGIIVLYVPAVIAAYCFDLQRLQTVLMFDVSEELQESYQRLLATFKMAVSSDRINYIAAEGKISSFDRKYHAGADHQIDSKPAQLSFRLPPRIKSNVTPACLKAGNDELYFLPDRILVKSDNRYGVVSFDALNMESATTNVIESSVPSDGRVVGRTWRYVNKKGGPDKRFNNNPELPIVEYSALAVKSSQGLNKLFYFSRPNTSDLVKRSMHDFSTSLQKLLEQQKDEVVTPETVPCIVETANQLPVSETLPASSDIYLGINGQTFGPYSPAVIAEWIETKQIGPETYFWSTEKQGWLAISEFSEIKTHS